MKRTGAQLLLFLTLAFAALSIVGTASAGWTWDESAAATQAAP